MKLIRHGLKERAHHILVLEDDGCFVISPLKSRKFQLSRQGQALVPSLALF